MKDRQNIGIPVKIVDAVSLLTEGVQRRVNRLRAFAESGLNAGFDPTLIGVKILSRTKKGSKAGREIWSKRANGVGTGWLSNHVIKKITHKIERQENKVRPNEIEGSNAEIRGG